MGLLDCKWIVFRALKCLPGGRHVRAFVKKLLFGGGGRQAVVPSKPGWPFPLHSWNRGICRAALHEKLRFQGLLPFTRLMALSLGRHDAALGWGRCRVNAA